MKLALTGGVAEGKSTVATYVREAGFDVVSADDIARGVFKLPRVQAELASLLGIAEPAEAPVVRKRIFADPLLRKYVNRLMHPIIMGEILRSPAPVVEAPLLFETCIHPLFERIWVVTCGPEEQLRRLIDRLGDEGSARSILKAQLSSRAKCAFADRIIRTNLPVHTVRSYVFESIDRDLQAYCA